MRRIASLCGLLAFAFASAKGAELAYLWDVITKPAYKQSLHAIVVGQPIDPWVKGLLAGDDGVSGPGKDVTIGRDKFELYNACQPHNCGGNFLYVLFTPGGGKAWAVFTKEGKIARYYGDPDAAKQLVLKDAAKP
jgi:hypothetical protein